MLDVLVVNAASTIMLLMAIEAMYPEKRLIHVFLDNARYHHAKLVQQWLARPECRIRLHFIPSYFTRAVINFLREKVPRNWHAYWDPVTDNFRVIDPADFRVLA